MTSTPIAAGRSEQFQRRMVTASVMMATTVVIIDMTIATIALPHMQGTNEWLCKLCLALVSWKLAQGL